MVNIKNNMFIDWKLFTMAKAQLMISKSVNRPHLHRCGTTNDLSQANLKNEHRITVQCSWLSDASRIPPMASLRRTRANLIIKIDAELDLWLTMATAHGGGLGEGRWGGGSKGDRR